MSRAFVKEQDTESIALPDRPISVHPNEVTPEGAAQIDAELAVARRAFATAQDADDKASMASASRDVRYWSARRATAQIILPSKQHDQVRFGATVKNRAR